MRNRRDIALAVVISLATEALVFGGNFRGWDWPRWVNGIQAPGGAAAEWFAWELSFFGMRWQNILLLAQAIGFATQVILFTIFLLGLLYCFRLVMGGGPPGPRAIS